MVKEQVIKGMVIHEWRGGKWQPHEGGVIAEQPVSLTVNGEVWLTFMCTPSDLEAQAVGFLFNENLVHSMDEVVSVRVCATGDNVDIWLDRSIERPQTWRRTSGCTGGVTAAKAANGRKALPDRLRLPAERISELVASLFDSQDLYKKVGGVHTTALSDGNEILFSVEDIGRHNTLDKIAGRCLMEGIDPSQKVLITTGRVSSEMMQKASRIGAEIVISRTSPTTLSVEMAEDLGITLIGYARRDRFTVYTHPHRVVVPTCTGGTSQRVACMEGMQIAAGQQGK